MKQFCKRVFIWLSLMLGPLARAVTPMPEGFPCRGPFVTLEQLQALAHCTESWACNNGKNALGTCIHAAMENAGVLRLAGNEACLVRLWYERNIWWKNPIKWVLDGPCGGSHVIVKATLPCGSQYYLGWGEVTEDWYHCPPGTRIAKLREYGLAECIERWRRSGWVFDSDQPSTGRRILCDDPRVFCRKSAEGTLPGDGIQSRKKMKKKKKLSKKISKVKVAFGAAGCILTAADIAARRQALIDAGCTPVTGCYAGDAVVECTIDQLANAGTFGLSGFDFTPKAGMAIEGPNCTYHHNACGRWVPESGHEFYCGMVKDPVEGTVNSVVDCSKSVGNWFERAMVLGEACDAFTSTCEPEAATQSPEEMSAAMNAFFTEAYADAVKAERKRRLKRLRKEWNCSAERKEMQDGILSHEPIR